MSDVDQQSQNGINNISKGANAVKSGINAGKNIAKIAKSQKVSSIMKMILSTIGPQGLALIGGIFVAGIIILMIISSANPSALFNTESQKLNKVKGALQSGYSSTLYNSKNYVIQYVNSQFNCKANEDDLTFENDEFTISTDYCDITAKFKPDVMEYAELIDAYATGVNSTIQICESDDESVELTESDRNNEISNAIVNPDNNGEMKLSRYGRDRINEYDSEYSDNQGVAYYLSLYFHSKQYFDVRYEPSMIENDTHKGKKPKEIKVCYIKDQLKQYNNYSSSNRKQVSCQGFHEEEEIEIIYLDATFGTITLPVDCDPTVYKRKLVEETKNNLIGKEVLLESTEQESSIPKLTKINNYNEASDYIEKIIVHYETAYIGVDPIYLQKGLPGWDGDAPSSAFNYQGYLNAGKYDYVWRHVHSITGTYSGEGSYRQCTEFVNGYLLDTYGIRATGDGKDIVANLVKDKGWNLLETPAPGSIFSASGNIRYPHGHTGVVLSVHNGTMVIAEGNYDEKGSLRIYTTTVDQFMNGRYAGRYVKFAAP